MTGTGWSGRRTLPGDWKTRRRAVLRRAGNQCEALTEADIRCVGPATEVDHITPVAEGGNHDLDNLCALCSGHHAVKSKAEAARGRSRWRAARPSRHRGGEPHPGLLR